MRTNLGCPTCGERGIALTGRCPRCGAAVDLEALPAGSSPELAAPEELIASWLSPELAPTNSRPAGVEDACPSCGYVGEMGDEHGVLICPACDAALPHACGRNALPLRRLVHCPTCNLAIGISDNERDKTVVCPRCKYFLGCVLRSEKKRSARRRG